MSTVQPYQPNGNNKRIHMTAAWCVLRQHKRAWVKHTYSRPGNTDYSLTRNVNLAAAPVELARPRTVSMSRLQPRRVQIRLIKERHTPPPPFRTPD
jgi:hypothetical protein